MPAVRAVQGDCERVYHDRHNHPALQHQSKLSSYVFLWDAALMKNHLVSVGYDSRQLVWLCSTRKRSGGSSRGPLLMSTRNFSRLKSLDLRDQAATGTNGRMFWHVSWEGQWNWNPRFVSGINILSIIHMRIQTTKITDWSVGNKVIYMNVAICPEFVVFAMCPWWYIGGAATHVRGQPEGSDITEMLVRGGWRHTAWLTAAALFLLIGLCHW